MGPTDYAKWQQLESRLNSEASTLLQDEEEDELTRKNKRDLEANCRGLITDELQPFVEKWGLSLDLALCLACKENQKDLVEQLLKHGIINEYLHQSHSISMSNQQAVAAKTTSN